jgi:hypothetical protein
MNRALVLQAEETMRKKLSRFFYGLCWSRVDSRNASAQAQRIIE